MSKNEPGTMDRKFQLACIRIAGTLTGVILALLVFRPLLNALTGGV